VHSWQFPRLYVNARNEFPGHGAPAHVSAMSHVPTLALHDPPVLYPHVAAVPLQKSPVQSAVFMLNVQSESGSWFTPVT